MRIIQSTKRILKPLVDFPTWMGYRTLVDNGKDVVAGLKGMFTPREPERTETFEEAITRLNLTEQELHARQRSLFILTLFWGLVAVAAFIYGIWLFFSGGFRGGLLAFALAFLATVLSFRQHFWYFQVKHRMLGADFKLWFNSLLGIKK